MLKKLFAFFLTLMVIFHISCYKTLGAEVERIVQGSPVLKVVEYEDYEIQARILYIKGTKIPVYCMDIEKSYPNGEAFKSEKSMHNLALASILNSGFPSKSAQDLGLSSIDDAYLATQIALWCYLENYDINKIISPTKDLHMAIRKIYDSQDSDLQSFNLRVLKSSNPSIQRVLYNGMPIKDTEQKG